MRRAEEKRDGAAEGPQVERLVAVLDGQTPEAMADLDAWIDAGCRLPDEARSWNLGWVDIGSTALLLARSGKVTDHARFVRLLDARLDADAAEWCGREQASNVYGHLTRTSLHHLLDALGDGSPALRTRVSQALARFARWYALAGEVPVGNRFQPGGYSPEVAAWMRRGKLPSNWRRGNRQALWALSRSWHREPVPVSQVDLRLRDAVVLVRGTDGEHACMPRSTAGYAAPGVQWVAAVRYSGAAREAERYVHTRTGGAMPDDAVEPWSVGERSEVILADRDGTRWHTGDVGEVRSRFWPHPPTVVYRGEDGFTVTLRGGAE